MITVLVVMIVNGIIWFVLGYKHGKEESVLVNEEDYQNAVNENRIIEESKNFTLHIDR